MPLFFFDLRSQRGLESDGTGLKLEIAEIADEGGRMLWRIPFSGILGEESMQ